MRSRYAIGAAVLAGFPFYRQPVRPWISFVFSEGEEGRKNYYIVDFALMPDELHVYLAKDPETRERGDEIDFMVDEAEAREPFTAKLIQTSKHHMHLHGLAQDCCDADTYASFEKKRLAWRRGSAVGACNEIGGSHSERPDAFAFAVADWYTQLLKPRCM